MKYLIIIFLGTLYSNHLSAQTDTIKLKDIPNYLNKKVTLKVGAFNCDSRNEYWYLYFGNRYPNQTITIMVKKHAGAKRMKLSMDVLVGRSMVYFTGEIVVYNGPRDTSANPEIKKLRKEIERPEPITIAGRSATTREIYEPNTAPIDLKCKLVMIISDQKQIGKKSYPIHGFVQDHSQAIMDFLNTLHDTAQSPK